MTTMPKEMKITVLDKAVFWAPVERVRADTEYAMRRDGQLKDGEFVAIKSHRIVQIDLKGQPAYDVYVTLEVQMGPGHPNPPPPEPPIPAPDPTKVPPGTTEALRL